MNAENLAIETDVFVAPRVRCLWISRDIPFPQNAGDRIYSANLAQALANANCEVHFLGYLNADAVQPHSNVKWLRVSGKKRGSISALLSKKPHIAAMHDTNEFQQLLKQQLKDSWDAIVLDGYASGWALPQCLELKQNLERRAPTLIYVSHNHETSVWRAMSRATKLSVKGVLVWQNYLKVRRLEQEIVKNVDVLTTITKEDAQVYKADAKSKFPITVVLTPGYTSTASQATRNITQNTPRHVVLLGSFHWAIKQENLRQLIAAADEEFAKHKIVLDVIGDVPEKLRGELSATAKATRFHGFVTDPGKLLENARIAVVPEVVGGGFKLKFLDYVFMRMPVFSLTAALAGVPSQLSKYMICSSNLHSLVDTIVQQIDDVETLNALQIGAYQAAIPLFRWQDRGDALANQIRSLQSSHE